MNDPAAEAEALRRLGVCLRVPWWRRRIQKRFVPARYRLWVQMRLLEVLGSES